MSSSNRGRWIDLELGGVADILCGFAFPTALMMRGGDGTRVLSGANIEFGGVDWSLERHWVRQPNDGFDRFELSEGDVVLGLNRPVVSDRLKFAILRGDDIPSLLFQRVARLRGTDTLDPGFLAAVIASPDFRDHVLRVQTGSTVPVILERHIREFRFRLPPLEDQRRIASVLGRLDDKIEHNIELCDRLGRVSASYLKVVLANGFELQCLGDLVEVVDCLHSRKPERSAMGKPLLQLENVRDDGLLDLSDTYLISEADYAEWTRRIEVRGGDCLITNVGRVGAVARIPHNVRAALGRNMTGLRTRRDFPFAAFVIETLLSSAFRTEIDLLTDSGTVMNALNVRNIPKLRLPAPSLEAVETFDGFAEPVWRLRENMLAENERLANIREALLPKLLSGRIRVLGSSDPDDALGAAAEAARAVVP